MSSSKILSMEEADRWVAEQRAAGLKIGFTCGSFDLLHAGHVDYLEQARALCDRLMVAVNSDASVARYKNPLRPVIPQDQRMFVVAGLGSVDAVTLMEDDRPLGLLLRWKPDLYIKGGDYAAESLRSGEEVQKYGGLVRVLKSAFPTSTSKIVSRIRDLEVFHVEHIGNTPKSHTGLVLLDRDGTLIRNVPFLHDPNQVELLPGVVEGLLKLQEAGFELAIVSNQQGIGLGYFTNQDFISVTQKLLAILGPKGIRIAKVYFCPHSMAEECNCRKPKPGMILRAMSDFQMKPQQTFLLGDSPADLEAGAAAGCRAILAMEGAFEAAVDQVLSQIVE